MHKTIQLLLEGWYGTGSVYAADHPLFREPINCEKLWQTSLYEVSTIFVNICHGIDGPIGSLTIDPNYVCDKVTLIIDTLMDDLTRQDVGGKEMMDVGEGPVIL